MELAVPNLHKADFLKMPQILILENWMPSIPNSTTLCEPTRREWESAWERAS